MPSSGPAAAYAHLKVHRYYSTLGLIVLVDAPTFSRQLVRSATPVRLLQVLDLRRPYEE